MSVVFGLKLTTVGISKFANALAETIALTELAVGDANGVEYTPTGTEVALVHEVARVNIASAQRNPDNTSQIIVEGIIPPEIGGFYVREFGIFDADGDMVAIGNYPSHYKPISSSGFSEELVIRQILTLANAASVALTVSAPTDFATYGYVDTARAAAIAAIHPDPVGTKAAPSEITAEGGIVSTAAPRQIHFVRGSGGPVDVTAALQVSAGVRVGQELLVIGTSDAQTVQLSDGRGLSLNGPCVLGANWLLGLFWDGSLWFEFSRREN